MKEYKHIGNIKLMLKISWVKKIIMIRSCICREYESFFQEIYLENGIIDKITTHTHLNLMKLLTQKMEL